MNTAPFLPDFAACAGRFARHGWRAECLGEAIWRYRRPGTGAPLRLILTAGIHGDETAPIEMLARRLPQWADGASTWDIDLLVAVGNLDAVAAGRRFVRHDMNRMFGPGPALPTWGAEGRRAALLQQAIAAMWGDGDAGVGATVHLDLHTTIRPSLKPTFAIVQETDPAAPLVRWLGSAGLHALVLSDDPGVTLSGFTRRLGAASCTAELGTVGHFGANDARLLTSFDAALDALVRSAGRTLSSPPARADGGAPRLYRTALAIVRHSEDFELFMPDDAPNFTPLPPGRPIARNGDGFVHCTEPGACILFPNAQVAVGLRAGLVVAPAVATVLADAAAPDGSAA